jgi:hypothetical protein
LQTLRAQFAVDQTWISVSPSAGCSCAGALSSGQPYDRP